MTGPPADPRGSERGTLLVELARRSIARGLGSDSEPPAIPETDRGWLERPAATFVTLTLAGRLRGCIGSLEARRSLREDVTDNARAAAFADSRFPPLTEDELDGLGIEVSVLTEPEPLRCVDQAGLLSALRPRVDGVVLECGSRRATFLPQVWKGLPEPSDFVAALKRKAGLEPDFWSDDLRFARYRVETYRAAAGG